MEGIDIDRLVWIEGHTESDRLHAYFNVGYTRQRVRKRMMRKSYIENDFDLLIEAAKRLCETQFDEDSDSDASTDDGHAPLGVEVDTAISFSDGSAYEGKDEEVRLVGAAAARFFWEVRPGEPGRSDSELQRDAVQSGGLPPWMQTNSGTGELEGTIVSICMHIDQEKRNEEGRAPVKTIHFVDYKSMVDVAWRPRLDEPRALAKLANRPQW
jgi:hypothetical protein